MSVTKSTKETLQFMLDGIKYVCENFKKRGPGTESERNAQAFFKKELEKYADSVEMEDFSLHPHAFMGFIIIAASLTLLSTVMFWLSPSSIIFPILGSVLTFFQF